MYLNWMLTAAGENVSSLVINQKKKKKIKTLLLLLSMQVGLYSEIYNFEIYNLLIFHDKPDHESRALVFFHESYTFLSRNVAGPMNILTILTVLTLEL